MEDSEQSRLKRFAENEWTTAIPSVLAESNLSAVRDALGRDWVFGLHHFYYGGRGPEAVAFLHWEEYVDHVQTSRPGDRLILWSVDSLRKLDKVLAEKPLELEGTEDLIEDARRSASHSLAQRFESGEAYEAIALRSLPNSVKVDSLWGDYDMLGSLPVFLRAANTAGSRWCILPITEVDRPRDQDRRRYVLVDAKCPNENGAVPVSGFY